MIKTSWPPTPFPPAHTICNTHCTVLRQPDLSPTSRSTASHALPHAELPHIVLPCLTLYCLQHTPYRTTPTEFVADLISADWSGPAGVNGEGVGNGEEEAAVAASRARVQRLVDMWARHGQQRSSSAGQSECWQHVACVLEYMNAHMRCCWLAQHSAVP